MSYTELLIDFGQKVKNERQKRKLTQKELGNLLGITHEWLCKIEKGRVPTISLQLYHKISEKLNVKFTWSQNL